jgi:glycosyltransferase involved in cell wall biosynthesis
VLPSHHEGYGMALAEASARGLPIVSTTGGAIPDTVPPDAGILVPPGDVDALAEALRRLLTDPGARLRLREAGLAARTRLPGWPAQAAAFAHELDLV